MGVKTDYPQLNIIDSETRHSVKVLEVILNVILYVKDLTFRLLEHHVNFKNNFFSRS